MKSHLIIVESSNNPLSPMHDDGPGSPLSIELKKLHKQNQIMRKNYLKEIQNLKVQININSVLEKKWRAKW